jgi:hypothetical protein
MFLRNKLPSIYMNNTKIVVSYLAKIAKSRNHLVVIGTKVEDKDLVSITSNGFAPSWNLLIRSFGITCAKTEGWNLVQRSKRK